MSKKKIYFITSNESKWIEYRKRFDSIGFDLIQHSAHLDEGRSMEIKDILELKLSQAKEILPNQRILIDDRGFFIDALNGFPGPYVKLMLNTIGVKNISKLMQNEMNKTAKFLTGVGYYDKKKSHYFIDEEVGFITDRLQGTNIRGWTDILKMYGYPAIDKKKSLAQYTDKEWNDYLTILSGEDHLIPLIEMLKNTV